MKKHFFIVSFILIFFLVFVGVISSFLLKNDTINNNFKVGNVEVEVFVYFEKYNDQNELIVYKDNLDYVATSVNEGSFTKFGVCRVNISDRNSIQFIENFRVEIKIYSNIDTYFRVAPYEQLTLTYEASGKIREVATTQKEYMDFNYDPESKCFDNRSYDGYIYCKEKVKRVDENTPQTITLIGDYYEGKSFGVYDERYSLQIGFIIEAVQSIDGPHKNWGLDQTPWRTNW